MPKFVDLSGQQFGRWTVVRRANDRISDGGTHYTQYECECECGVKRLVTSSSLKSGRSTSCGCYHSEVSAQVCKRNFRTHGETKSRLYQIYAGIKKRCGNPNASNYADYGGRGIAICDEWANSWSSFRDWALNNGYTDDLSIDRIDVNGNYEPNNCRWVACVVQANNRRSSRYITYNNETHTVSEWAKILNIPYKSLHKKLSKGMTLDKIATT